MHPLEEAVLAMLGEICCSWRKLSELSETGLALLRAVAASGASRVLRKLTEWLAKLDAELDVAAELVADMQRLFETSVSADTGTMIVLIGRSSLPLLEVCTNVQTVWHAYAQDGAAKSLMIRDAGGNNLPAQQLTVHITTWESSLHLRTPACRRAMIRLCCEAGTA
jgi:hypothetical protein